MPTKPTISHTVQLFVLVKGRLAQGGLLDCRTSADACRIAEEKVRNGRAVGAAAFVRTVTDPEYDDAAEATALALFGRVPPGLADQVPF